MRARVSALKTLGVKGEYYQDGRFQRYKIPDARKYCQEMAENADPDIRKVAEDMRRYLVNDLVVPALRDEPKEREELLRATMGEQSSASGDELLRGSEAPPSPPMRQPGLWGWLRHPSAEKRTKDYKQKEK